MGAARIHRVKDSGAMQQIAVFPCTGNVVVDPPIFICDCPEWPRFGSRQSVRFTTVTVTSMRPISPSSSVASTVTSYTLSLPESVGDS